MIGDIDKLQLCQSHQIFDYGIQLFLDKWREVCIEFIQYFETEWLHKNRYWYEGARILTPKTNNALEATNRVIKNEHTLRRRYDFSRFRAVLCDMIKNWSLGYESGVNEYHTTPNIELKMWTTAYSLAKQNIEMFVDKSHENITYYLNSPAVSYTTYKTFDDFKRNHFSIVCVKFPAPYTRGNWHKGICSCRNYFKLYMCEHILCISLRSKYVSSPEEAKCVPIGQKRKRGRPALAKAALVFQ